MGRRIDFDTDIQRRYLRDRRPFRFNLPWREAGHVLQEVCEQHITVTEYFSRLVQSDASKTTRYNSQGGDDGPNAS